MEKGEPKQETAAGEEPKKLTLKEKMALAKKKTSTVDSFVPEPAQAQQPPAQESGANLMQQMGFGQPGPAETSQQLLEEYKHTLAYCYSPQGQQQLMNMQMCDPFAYQKFVERFNYVAQRLHSEGLLGDLPGQEEQEPEQGANHDEAEGDETEEFHSRGIGYKPDDKNKKKKDKKKAGTKPGTNPKPLPSIKLPILPPAPKKYVEEKIDVQGTYDNEKNKDKVLDMSKEPMNLIFIGHVDSGKSTICGATLILSGKVDKEEYRKYEIEAKEKNRSGWVQAYIMDINEEERDKGITVEIGKASFELKKKRFTIIDCPGHKNYVPNMIAGASQADIAALIISAKSGEFEIGFERGGQTREHAILAAYLGSSHLVVVINKMDDCGWDIKRFNYIKDTMSPFLRDICEYNLETSVTWVPISGMGMVNMNEIVPPSVCPWYKGQCLFDTLDNLPKARRELRDCLRLPVSDRYSDKGDLTVYGKLESGHIKEGMKMMLMPTKKEVQCLKIFDQEDKNIVMASQGDNIKLFIKGVEAEEIRRGFVLCGLQYLCHLGLEFEAELTVMDPPSNKVISNGFPAVLHLHAIQEECEITAVKSNKSSGKTGGLLCLKQGETGKVVIKVAPSHPDHLRARPARLPREVRRVP